MATLTVLDVPDADDTLAVSATTLTAQPHYASGTLAFSGAEADETFAVGGVTFTVYENEDALNAAQDPAGLLLAASDTLQAAAAMDAIHAHPVAGELVRCSYAAGVLTLVAREAGEDGNSIALAGDTGITASDTTLLGAVAVGEGEFNTVYASGAEAAIAADLAAQLAAAGFTGAVSGAVVTVTNVDGSDPVCISSNADAILAAQRISARNRVRLVPLVADPDEGAVGDLIVVGTDVKVCTVAQDGETPATYVVVGTQS